MKHDNPGPGLDGHVVWIIGAGSGIGAACAFTLSRAGARVILTGRRADALECVAGRITCAGGASEVAAGDTTRSDQVAVLAHSISTRYGRIDALLNCAGVNVTARSWKQVCPKTIDTVIDGNLKNAYYTTAAVLPFMRERRNGSLVHFSSWAGRYPSPASGSSYAASKAALIAMSQTLNMEECLNGIRSTVICPASVATDLLAKRPTPPTKAELEQMLQPDDLAQVVLFVLTRPPNVCLNEILLSPTLNRHYIAALSR